MSARLTVSVCSVLRLLPFKSQRKARNKQGSAEKKCISLLCGYEKKNKSLTEFFLLSHPFRDRLSKRKQVKNEKYFLLRFTDMEKLFHFHFAFLYGNARHVSLARAKTEMHGIEFKCKIFSVGGINFRVESEPRIKPY